MNQASPSTSTLPNSLRHRTTSTPSWFPRRTVIRKLCRRAKVRHVCTAVVEMTTHDFYRPQTKFAKVMFLQVSVCPRGGHAWLLPGGRAWLLRGGVRAWLLPGGVCVVAPGGACVVAPGGHAWLLQWGHVWLLPGGVHGFFDEIRSMSGQYASYWNAFLYEFVLIIVGPRAEGIQHPEDGSSGVTLR